MWAVDRSSHETDRDTITKHCQLDCCSALSLAIVRSCSLLRELTCQCKRPNRDRRHPSCTAHFASKLRHAWFQKHLVNQAPLIAKRTPSDFRQIPQLPSPAIARFAARSPSRSNTIQKSTKFGNAHRLNARPLRDGQSLLHTTVLLVQRGSWQRFVNKSVRVF
jgi:hypothetical protein